MTEHPTGNPGPFDREIDVRAILKIGMWLAVVTLCSYVVAWGFYRLLSSEEAAADPKPSPIAEAQRPRVPPGPHLQANPERELAAFRKGEDERLAGWGWVDRGTGVAHVPVERAIDEVAAAGSLPDFMPPPPPAPEAEP